MPPKRAIRRPAARAPPGVPVGVLRRPAQAKTRSRARARAGAETDPWTKIEDLKIWDVTIGKKYIAKIWYGVEESMAHIEALEVTTDAEGQWLGVRVLGTPCHQLRSWVVSQTSTPPRLYLSFHQTAPGDRKNLPGIGYLLALKEVTPEDKEGWMDNCTDLLPEGEDENADLRGMARQFGFPNPPPPEAAPRGAREAERVDDKRPEQKKLSGRQKVKKMIEKAKWSPLDTPVDPNYHKPIKLKVKKKKSSSSSDETVATNQTDSSEEGLGTEHRIKTIGRKLPGYLCRASAREAKKMLAEAVGESPQSYKVFLRYYRQVPKGGVEGHAKRNAYPQRPTRHSPGGKRTWCNGHNGPEIEGPRNDATGLRSKLGSSSRIASKGPDGLGCRQRSPVCSKKVLRRSKATTPAERITLGSQQGNVELSSEGSAERREERPRQRQGQRQKFWKGVRRQQSRDPSRMTSEKVVLVSSEDECQEAVEDLISQSQERAEEFLRSKATGGCAENFLAPGGSSAPVKVKHLAEDPSHGGAAFDGNAVAFDSEPGFEISARVSSLGKLEKQVSGLLPRILSDFGAKRGSVMEGIFPLPLPHDWSNHVCELFKSWEEGVIRSINWMVTGSFLLGDPSSNVKQARLLEEVRRSLVLLETWKEVDFDNFNPQVLFHQRWVNSYGEEVHVAQSLRRENIRDSLPKEGVAGIVRSWEICKGGFKDFILHPEKWLKPIGERVWVKPPRVQVPQDSWREVVEGLLSRKVCGIMPLEEAFKVQNQPILGGLFGVPKNESTPEGVPVLRLIMDLRPINENFLALRGELSTLPVLSQMFQLHLQPEDGLLISSEDIRAMFYVIGVPESWYKFLCFSRPIPEDMRPPGAVGEYVLHSRVLPMGYVNSVSLAQHLHRQIIMKSFGGVLGAQQEIRRDREFPESNLWFRTYLDNFDLLSIRS